MKSTLAIAVIFIFLVASSFSVSQTVWIGHCEISVSGKSEIDNYSVIKAIRASSRDEAKRLFNNYIITTYPKGKLEFKSYMINSFYDCILISSENPMGN